MRLILFLSLFPAILAARFDEAGRVLWAGSRLSTKDAEKLERALQSKPDDLKRHATLLGYYFARMHESPGDASIDEARARHLQWLISHNPDSDFARFEAAWLLPSTPPQSAGTYAALKSLWLEQAKVFPKSPAILGNAARFLMTRDRDQARQLVSQALRLEPQSGDLWSMLGTLDGLAIVGVRELDRHGLPVPPTSPEPMAPDGVAALKGAGQSDESDRLCGTGMAIIRYGSPFLGFPAGERMWATAALTLARALQLGNQDKECLRYAIRLNTWNAMRRQGWLAGTSQTRAILVDGELAQTWIRLSVPPVYPRLARMDGLQGAVSLIGRIAADGRVAQAEAVAGPSQLRQAALDALKRWTYAPLIINGAAVEFLTDVQIHFTLSR
jgi:periplasmic protein TonB